MIRLQDGAGRHCVEAEGFVLSLRPLAGLAQDEEPGMRGVRREAEEDWGR